MLLFGPAGVCLAALPAPAPKQNVAINKRPVRSATVGLLPLQSDPGTRPDTLPPDTSTKIRNSNQTSRPSFERGVFFLIARKFDEVAPLEPSQARIKTAAGLGRAKDRTQVSSRQQHEMKPFAAHSSDVRGPGQMRFIWDQL